MLFSKPSALLLLTLATSFSAVSQDKTPKYSNEFLNIGVSARALGMSNAFLATCNDVTAGYWNPSALLDMKGDMQKICTAMFTFVAMKDGKPMPHGLSFAELSQE